MKSNIAIFESYSSNSKQDIRKALASSSRKIGSAGWISDMRKDNKTSWITDILDYPKMQDFIKKGGYSVCSTIAQLSNGTLVFRKNPSNIREEYFAFFVKSKYLRLIIGDNTFMLSKFTPASLPDLKFIDKALDYIDEKYHIDIGDSAVTKAAHKSNVNKGSNKSLLIDELKKIASDNNISDINWTNINSVIQTIYTTSGVLKAALNQTKKLNSSGKSNKLIFPIVPKSGNQIFVNLTKDWENPNVEYMIMSQSASTTAVLQMIKASIEDINISSSLDYVICYGFNKLDDLNINLPLQ